MKAIKISVLFVISIVILGVVGFFIVKPILYKSDLPKPVTINTINQPMIGNPKAKIHFVVFEDLKCSNCARFNNTVFPYLKKKYIETSQANYTMINLAFIPGSMPAANAARCIYMQNNALFFDYIDAIYKNQPPEDSDWATVPKLMIIASRIKAIQSDQLAQCLIQD